MIVRAELVKLALARSLREEFNRGLRNDIVTVLGAQPEWQTEYEYRGYATTERAENSESVWIEFW
jgi:hypothetical protein